MKTTKWFIGIILLSILLSSSKCSDDEGHKYIIISNQSDKTIVWQPRFFRIGATDEQYDCQYVLGGSIHSNSSCKFDYDDRGNIWEVGLNTHCLQLILMDEDVYSQYYLESCDTFRKYVPILHRYQLTLEDLQRMNWTVIYPPEE